MKRSIKILLTALCIIAVAAFIIFFPDYGAVSDQSPLLEPPIETEPVETPEPTPQHTVAVTETPEPTPTPEDTEKFTELTEVIDDDNCVGEIEIPVINLKYSVFDSGDEYADMILGVSHFRISSTWDGNICLAGHNRGINTHFGKLKDLKEGDEIIYRTVFGERRYAVDYIAEIEDTDWSRLQKTKDNKVTMITCINNQPTKRLCVQGTEIAEGQ